MWYVCGFVCRLGILRKPTNLAKFGKFFFIKLWELQREKDFRSIMGAKGRTRFLESNLSLC
jgi:hypothetical protein